MKILNDKGVLNLLWSSIPEDKNTIDYILTDLIKLNCEKKYDRAKIDIILSFKEYFKKYFDDFSKKDAENKMEEKIIIEFIPESNEKKIYDKILFNYFFISTIETNSYR